MMLLLVIITMMEQATLLQEMMQLENYLLVENLQTILVMGKIHILILQLHYNIISLVYKCLIQELVVQMHQLHIHMIYHKLLYGGNQTLLQ